MREESEVTAVSVLLLIADMFSHVQDESEASEYNLALLQNCTKMAPMHASDFGDPGENNELRLFPRMLIEALYRVARFTDMSRSCNMLAAALASLVHECEALESTIIDVLSAIIPKLPVEHLEPLFTLQTT